MSEEPEMTSRDGLITENDEFDANGCHVIKVTVLGTPPETYKGLKLVSVISRSGAQGCQCSYADTDNWDYPA